MMENRRSKRRKLMGEGRMSKYFQVARESFPAFLHAL